MSLTWLLGFLGKAATGLRYATRKREIAERYSTPLPLAEFAAGHGVSAAVADPAAAAVFEGFAGQLEEFEQLQLLFVG